MAMQTQPARAQQEADTIYVEGSSPSKGMIEVIQPSYEEGVLTMSPWRGNWFIGVDIGGGAFIGNPPGCNDFFGRTRLAVGASIGKWFTPSIGGRIAYQGWQLLDANNKKNTYHLLHGDLLWNVLGETYKNSGKIRWRLSPFIGGGVIADITTSEAPATLFYGIIAQYNCCKRAGIQIEVSNATTFAFLDGIYGKRRHIGDNLLSFKVGLTINIGKIGWKRVETLSTHSQLRENGYERLRESLEEKDTETIYEHNNYSGLNSLRARLAEKEAQDYFDMFEEVEEEIDDNEEQNYIFYFKIASVNLVDTTQVRLLDEIAQEVLTNDYNASVVGSADKATGTEEYNKELSAARALFIANELIKRGVSEESIYVQGIGGTDECSPKEKNRSAKVTLYVRESNNSM